MKIRRAKPLSVSNALLDQRLFGAEQLFGGESWNTWRAVLKAAFAEPLTDDELETFVAVADRDPPARRVKELVAIVGRGGGKDSTASFIAAYIAMPFDPRAGKLRPGELAATRQASVNYCLQYGNGGSDCSFTSKAQCEATASGGRAECFRNYYGEEGETLRW